MSTETIILPKNIKKRIRVNMLKCRQQFLGRGEIALSMYEEGYKTGAIQEAVRSLKLVKALSDLRHGLFSSEEDVNNLIDQTLHEYNTL